MSLNKKPLSLSFKTKGVDITLKGDWDNIINTVNNALDRENENPSYHLTSEKFKTLLTRYLERSLPDMAGIQSLTIESTDVQRLYKQDAFGAMLNHSGYGDYHPFSHYDEDTPEDSPEKQHLKTFNALQQKPYKPEDYKSVEPAVNDTYALRLNGYIEVSRGFITNSFNRLLGKDVKPRTVPVSFVGEYMRDELHLWHEKTKESDPGFYEARVALDNPRKHFLR